MRKITRITTQKKNKNRYNVFLEAGEKEEFGFGVDEAVLIEYMLRKGLELDEALIQELLEKDTLHKSYTQAIHFLSYRMRTKKEINDYLVKKETEPEHISRIMQKLISDRLIDDEQFAEMFVRTRIHTSDKGPVLIKQEMIEKGVAPQIAENAIEAYPYDAQFEKAMKLIQKKMQKKQNKSYRNQLKQAQSALVQKGFTKDIIADVSANLDGARDDAEEWEALVYQGEKLLRKQQSKHSGYTLEMKVKEGLYRKGFPLNLIQAFLENERNK